MKYLALILLLIGCGSSEKPDGLIYYKQGDPYIDSVVAEAQTRLPFGVKLIGSDTREDLRIERSEDGLTEGCAHTCSSSGWVKVVERNELGSRRELAVWGVVHEVGHMLGASHRESRLAIMNTDILHNFEENELQWLDESLEEIMECMG